MSSIRLKKEYEGKKPGTVISVPFILGKQLRADGIGEYWNGDEGEKNAEEAVAAPGPTAKPTPAPTAKPTAPAANK